MPGGTLEGWTSLPSTIVHHIKNHEEVGEEVAGEGAREKVEVAAEDVIPIRKPCLPRRLNLCGETSLHIIDSRPFKTPSLPQPGRLEDN